MNNTQSHVKILKGLVKDYISDERHLEANAEKLKFIISMHDDK